MFLDLEIWSPFQWETANCRVESVIINWGKTIPRGKEQMPCGSHLQLVRFCDDHWKTFIGEKKNTCETQKFSFSFGSLAQVKGAASTK